MQKALSLGFPGCSESQWEDEHAVRSEEDEQRKSTREAFLKFTLQFLKTMKQDELADSLLYSKRKFLKV